MEKSRALTDGLTDSNLAGKESFVSYAPLIFVGYLLAVSAALGGAAYYGRPALLFALGAGAGCFFLVMSRPHLGVMILITTMLLSYPEALRGRGFLTINNLLGAILALVLVLRTALDHDFWFFHSREIRILILVGLVFLLSTLLAEVMLPELRYRSLWYSFGRRSGWVPIQDLTRSWFIVFVARLAFLLFFVNFITTRRHIKVVLVIVMSAVLFVLPAALEVYMSAKGDDFRVSAEDPDFGGTGWISNENHFALMCLVGSSLLFYFARSARNTGLKLMILILGLALTAMVVLSGSRSGLLGLLFLGIWVFTRPGLSASFRLGILLVGISVLCTFLLLTPSGTQERLLNINPFDPRGEGGRSTKVRTVTLLQSLDIFARYPLLGVGLGNFRRVNSHFNGSVRPPHNSYLWALSEGGISVFLLYVLLFLSIFRRLRVIREKFRHDPIIPRIGEWLSFYFFLFLFFSLFADTWLSEIHLYLITALTVVLIRLPSESEQEQMRQGVDSTLSYA